MQQSSLGVPQAFPCHFSLGLNSVYQWTAFSLVSFLWWHTWRSPPCCSSHPLWFSALTILMPSLQAEGMLLSSSCIAHPSLHSSSLHLTSVRDSLILPNQLPEFNHSLAHRGGLCLCFDLELLCSSGQILVSFSLLIPWTTQHLPFWNSLCISSLFTSRLQNTIEGHCFRMVSEYYWWNTFFFLLFHWII